jgi:hypothetical protein
MGGGVRENMISRSIFIKYVTTLNNRTSNSINKSNKHIMQQKQKQQYNNRDNNIMQQKQKQQQ